MKLFIASADASGRVDNTVLHGLLEHLSICSSQAEADAIFVPVSWYADFRFSTDLYKLKKPVVLVDFTEYGWDWDQNKPNLLGTGMTRNYFHLSGDEYARLDDWVKLRPPTVHFKRELLARDRTSHVLPICFPCRIPAPPIETREQFNARPIEVFFSWGLSHPSRQRLHGHIFQSAHERGINVIDSWEDEGRFEKRTWVSIYSPHWRRKPMEEVMRWQNRSKLTVSLPGAGAVCFRSAEAPVGSIMALQYDNLAWPHLWNHLDNCIRLPIGNSFQGFENHSTEFECLCESINHPELYDIYLSSQETIDRYRGPRLAREYMLSAIEELL